MSFHAQFDRLTALLNRLDHQSGDDRRETLANEVIETGGTWIIPDAAAGASHLVEISLHGVAAYGHSEREAIRNWIKAARASQCPAWGDGLARIDPPFAGPCAEDEIDF